MTDDPSGGLLDQPPDKQQEIYEKALDIQRKAHAEDPPHSPAEARGKPEGSEDFLLWPDTCPADIFLKRDFPPIRWMVPNVFPEGATLLAGRPKCGKTFLALNVAWAVAAGGSALGKVAVEQGRVLYLALEGSQRNMQDRLRALSRNCAPPKELELVFTWPPLDEGGAEMLHSFLRVYGDTRLVVIDTFKRIRGGSGTTRSAKTLYDEDYEAIQQFSRLAEDQGCGILLIHHTNKMTGTDDPLDMISGSTGLVAAVDTGAVLTFAPTGGTALYVRGRDIERTELALSWDDQLMTWCLEGDASKFRQSAERQVILDAVRRGLQSPREVADYTALSYDSVRHLMVRLAAPPDNKLTRVATGRYAVRTHGLTM